MQFKLLIVFVCFLQIASVGQVSSPYSEIGFGGRNSMFLFDNFVSGGSGAALNYRRSINVLNPASASSIDYTIAQAGVAIERNNFNQNGQSGFGSNFDLGGIVLGFPLNNNSGLSLGLLPFSGKQYEYSKLDTAFSGTEPMTRTFSGQGNISDLFVMYGYDYKGFSAGIKGQFLFGNLNDIVRSEFDSEDYLNMRDQNFLLVRSFSYQFGLQYKLNILDEAQLLFGISGSPTQKINAFGYRKLNDYEVTTTLDADQNTVDVERHDLGTVIENTIDDKSDEDFTLGGDYRVGITYQNPDHFKVGTEYHFTNGAATQMDGVNLYRDASVYRVYGEWIPNINAAGYGSFWKTARYQVGAFYGQSSIIPSAEVSSMDKYGMNFGLSFPLSKYKYESDRFGSYLNLGVGYMSRGNENLIQENVLQFMFGITLNDKWFIQRKIK